MAFLHFITNPLTKERVEYENDAPTLGLLLQTFLLQNPEYYNYFSSIGLSMRVNNVLVPAEKVNETLLTATDMVVVIPDIEIAAVLIPILAQATAAVGLTSISAGIAGSTAVMAGTASVGAASMIGTGAMIGGYVGVGIGAMVSMITPMALMYGLSKAFSPAKPSMGKGDGSPGESSPTYGFEGVKSMATEGIPKAVIYGTVKTGGNRISITAESKMGFLYDWFKPSDDLCGLIAIPIIPSAALPIPVLNLGVIGLWPPVRGWRCKVNSQVWFYVFFRFRLWSLGGIKDLIHTLGDILRNFSINFIGRLISEVFGKVLRDKTMQFGKTGSPGWYPGKILGEILEEGWYPGKILCGVLESIQERIDSNKGSYTDEFFNSIQGSIRNDIFDVIDTEGITRDHFNNGTNDTSINWTDPETNNTLVDGPDKETVIQAIIDLYNKFAGVRRWKITLFIPALVGSYFEESFENYPDTEDNLGCYLVGCAAIHPDAVIPQWWTSDYECLSTEAGTYELPNGISFPWPVMSPSDEQYLHVLTALGEGELTGIERIYLNKQPIESYPAVSHVFLPGKNTQIINTKTNTEWHYYANTVTPIAGDTTELVNSLDYSLATTTAGANNVYVHLKFNAFRVDSKGHLCDLKNDAIKYCICVGVKNISNWGADGLPFTYDNIKDLSNIQNFKVLPWVYEMKGGIKNDIYKQHAALPIVDFIEGAIDDWAPMFTFGVHGIYILLGGENAGSGVVSPRTGLREFDSYAYTHTNTDPNVGIVYPPSYLLYHDAIETWVKEQFNDFFLTSERELEVRVIRFNEEPDKPEYSAKMWVMGFDEVRYATFNYPNTALLGVKARATAQLNNQPPEITAIVKGKKIWVPKIVHVNTNEEVFREHTWFDEDVGYYRSITHGGGRCIEYDGQPDINGVLRPKTLTLQYCNNPIWCLYDLLSNDRYGLGNFIEKGDLDFDQFVEMAHYCDQMVPDGVRRFADSWAIDRIIDTDTDYFTQGSPFFDENDNFDISGNIADQINHNLNTPWEWAYKKTLVGEAVFTKNGNTTALADLEDESGGKLKTTQTYTWSKAVIQDVPGRPKTALAGFTNCILKLLPAYGANQFWTNSGPGQINNTNMEYQLGHKRFELNLVIDDRSSAIDIIKQICDTFRCWPVWTRGAIKPVIDKPTMPSALFGMGNVIKESLQILYGSLNQVPNVLECQYSNAETQYEKDSMIYIDPDIDIANVTDIKGVQRKQSLKLLGITNPTQIKRELIYRLNLLKRNNKTISFKTGIEGITLCAGEVFNFTHDILTLGSKSGRIMTYDTTNHIVYLDQDGPTYVANTKIEIRRVVPSTEIETVVTCNVLTINGNQVLIDIPSQYSGFVPQAYDTYAIGVVSFTTESYRAISVIPDEQDEVTVIGVKYDTKSFGWGRPWFGYGVSNTDTSRMSYYDTVTIASINSRVPMFQSPTQVDAVGSINITTAVNKAEMRVEWKNPQNTTKYVGCDVEVSSVNIENFQLVGTVPVPGQLLTVPAHYLTPDQYNNFRLSAKYNNGQVRISPIVSKIFDVSGTFKELPSGTWVSGAASGSVSGEIPITAHPVKRMYTDGLSRMPEDKDEWNFCTKFLQVGWDEPEAPYEGNPNFGFLQRPYIRGYDIQIAGSTLSDPKYYDYKVLHTIGNHPPGIRSLLVPRWRMWTKIPGTVLQWDKMKTICIGIKTVLNNGDSSEVSNFYFHNVPPSAASIITATHILGSCFVAWNMPDDWDDVEEYHVFIALRSKVDKDKVMTNWKLGEPNDGAIVTKVPFCFKRFRLLDPLNASGPYDEGEAQWRLLVDYPLKIDAYVIAIDSAGNQSMIMSSIGNEGVDVTPPDGIGGGSDIPWSLTIPMSDAWVWQVARPLNFSDVPNWFIGLFQVIEIFANNLSIKALLDGKTTTSVAVNHVLPFDPLNPMWSMVERFTYRHPGETFFTKMTIGVDQPCHVWIEFIDQYEDLPNGSVGTMHKVFGAAPDSNHGSAGWTAISTGVRYSLYQYSSAYATGSLWDCFNHDDNDYAAAYNWLDLPFTTQEKTDRTLKYFELVFPETLRGDKIRLAIRHADNDATIFNITELRFTQKVYIDQLEADSANIGVVTAGRIVGSGGGFRIDASEGYIWGKIGGFGNHWMDPTVQLREYGMSIHMSGDAQLTYMVIGGDPNTGQEAFRGIRAYTAGVKTLEINARSGTIWAGSGGGGFGDSNIVKITGTGLEVGSGGSANSKVVIGINSFDPTQAGIVGLSGGNATFVLDASNGSMWSNRGGFGGTVLVPATSLSNHGLTIYDNFLTPTGSYIRIGRANIYEYGIYAYSGSTLTMNLNANNGYLWSTLGGFGGTGPLNCRVGITSKGIQVWPSGVGGHITIGEEVIPYIGNYTGITGFDSTGKTTFAILASDGSFWSSKGYFGSGGLVAGGGVVKIGQYGLEIGSGASTSRLYLGINAYNPAQAGIVATSGTTTTFTLDATTGNLWANAGGFGGAGIGSSRVYVTNRGFEMIATGGGRVLVGQIPAWALTGIFGFDSANKVTFYLEGGAGSFWCNKGDIGGSIELNTISGVTIEQHGITVRSLPETSNTKVIIGTNTYSPYQVGIVGISGGASVFCLDTANGSIWSRLGGFGGTSYATRKVSINTNGLQVMGAKGIEVLDGMDITMTCTTTNPSIIDFKNTGGSYFQVKGYFNSEYSLYIGPTADDTGNLYLGYSDGVYRYRPKKTYIHSTAGIYLSVVPVGVGSSQIITIEPTVISIAANVGGISIYAATTMYFQSFGQMSFRDVGGVTYTLAQLAAGTSSGVASLNSLTGALTLAGSGIITITPSGNTITIGATGGSSTTISNGTTSVSCSAAQVDFYISGQQRMFLNATELYVGRSIRIAGNISMAGYTLSSGYVSTGQINCTAVVLGGNNITEVGNISFNGGASGFGVSNAWEGVGAGSQCGVVQVWANGRMYNLIGYR